MTLFQNPIWPYVKPYVHLVPGRDNCDFLQLPDDLRFYAMQAVANCVTCGAVIHPMRARAKSERSRIAGTEVEHRLFYAPTCPIERDPGCSRSKLAREHKQVLLRKLGICTQEHV